MDDILKDELRKQNGESQQHGLRAAALRTIAIVDRFLPADANCYQRAKALEEAYPFWVENGYARQQWRRHVRAYLKTYGCRVRPRHDGKHEESTERVDERRLRLRVKYG